MARVIKMTASCYVTGNIDKKSRGRWVDAIPTAADPTTLDDIELGKLARAGSRVLKHAKFSLNKLNQEGGKNSWTRHMTEEKNKVQKHLDVLNPFCTTVEDECAKRQKEDYVAPQPPKKKGSRSDYVLDGWAKEAEFTSPEPADLLDLPDEAMSPLEPTGPCHAVDEPVKFEPRTEPTGQNLYELFCDTPQRELMELAYKGLEAGKSQISPEELTNLRGEVDEYRTVQEELRELAEERKDQLGEVRTANKRLTVENRKLRRVLKGVHTECMNQANRLNKYTTEPATETEQA